MKSLSYICCAAVGTMLCAATSRLQAAPTFVFTPTPGMPANVLNGFQQAANIWSSALTDNVTVNITIDYLPKGAGTLGETSSARSNFTYSNFLSKITADRTSASDFQAVSKLATGSSFPMRINYTANNPNGVGSSVGYLDNDGDANNTTIRSTRANAKALGLISATNTTSDGHIEFSSNFNWDFDRSDGIAAGKYDFIGVATHEIGHLLGFNSGVGTLDANAPDPDTNSYLNDDFFDVVHPMDMFRFSTASTTMGVIDYTAGTSDKYFSIDGGVTKIASFSTGSNLGDGRQTGHWKDNLGIGIMDPTIGSGQMAQLTANDLLLFDVIGWDLASVPEPSPVAILAVLSSSLLRRKR